MTNKKVKITKIIHSCFLIEYSDGKTILIDPFFCKIIPPEVTCFETPTLKMEDIPKLDLVLITHEHFDHFDKEAVEFFVKRDNCIVVAPRNTIQQVALPKNNERIVKIDDNLIVSLVNIKVLPSQHPQSFYSVGYLINYNDITIYHAGDASNLPEVNFKADIAMMPAGGTVTADLFVFVSMARRLMPKVAIPMHYNTFNFIQTDIDKLKERSSEKLKEIKVEILKNGESFEY